MGWVGPVVPVEVPFVIRMFTSSVGVVPLTVTPKPRDVKVSGKMVRVSLTCILVSSSFGFMLMGHTYGVSCPVFGVVGPTTVQGPLISVPGGLGGGYPRGMGTEDMVGRVVMTHFAV